MENLIKELDLFVKITGKTKSIALRSIHNQLTQRVLSQNRQCAERESEYAAADENIVLDGAASILRTHNIKPDVIGETNEEQEPRQALVERSQRQANISQQASSARMDQLARGLHPTVSPALKSL